MTAAAEDAVAAVGAASTGAAVFGIVLVAIEAAVTQGINAVAKQHNVDDDATLPALLTQAKALNNQDLKQMVRDSDGFLKICEAFIQATYPDSPSTAPLPTPTTTQAFLARLPDGTYQPLPTMQYQGTDGTTWSAQPWNGWLLQTAQVNGVQQSSFGLDIRYRDPVSFTNKIATRVAPNFWEVENLNFDGNAQFCPINPALGSPIRSRTQFSTTARAR